MKQILRMTLFAALFLAGGAALASGLWLEDYNVASRRAKEQNRFLLLNFTGSNWCGWCIKLHGEVFSQKAFTDFAGERLVCMTVDFPMGKPQSEKTQKQNQHLSQVYGIRGYPTIILLDADGQLAAMTGYRAGGAGEYVKHLQELMDLHAQKTGTTAGQPAEVEVKP